MSDETQVEQLLRRLGEAERDAILQLWPDAFPTADCPPLPAFAVAARTGDWSAIDTLHLTGCDYCRRTRSSFAKRRPMPLVVVLLLQRVPTVLLPKSDEVADPVPDRSAAWKLVPPAESRQRWQDGTLAVELPPDLARHYYGDETTNSVELTLQAVTDPDGSRRPRLRVLPGPTHQPMRLTATFPGGPARTFTVPARGAEAGTVGTSDPGDPLPAEAFGSAGPGSPAPTLKLVLS